MKRLLWVGDAACGSGFGKATHHILPELQAHGWHIEVLGVNFRGDPHDEPYRIYPALIGGDVLGIGRLADSEFMRQRHPDLIVLQTNPWNVPRYMDALAKSCKQIPPVAGVIAVEGKNCWGKELNKLTKAIFWVNFGREEAVNGGMTVPSTVIPLGVDLEIFKPGDCLAAREFLGLPAHTFDKFIVGNVNRNQNRKRLDLTIKYFAEWVRTRNIDNALLYLHVLPGSSTRVNCGQLAEYYGVGKKLILAEPRNVFEGAPVEYVVSTYQAFNIQLTTTLGEGFGLTTLEGAACGIAQAAGDYAAIGEWGAGGVELIPCSEEGVMPDVRNMLGAPPDMLPTLAVLDRLYFDVDYRRTSRLKALHMAHQQEFRWEAIAKRYAKELEDLC